MKFKIGDKVRIIANTNGSRNKVGDIGVVATEPSEGGRYQVDVKERPISLYESGNWTKPDEMELVEEEWSEWMEAGDAYNFIGVGKSMYEGDFKQQYINGITTYSFPMSRKRKPVVEEVKHFVVDKKHILIYNTIDGEIDCSSVKMEKLNE